MGDVLVVRVDLVSDVQDAVHLLQVLQDVVPGVLLAEQEPSWKEIQWSSCYSELDYTLSLFVSMLLCCNMVFFHFVYLYDKETSTH